jgi:hypothetical protein
MVIALLSKTEQAYLSGTREFTKTQQRYIRYRLNKKLKRLDDVDASILAGKSRDAAAAAAAFRDGGPDEPPSSKRKAEDLQFFPRSRTTFSRLCKASAFLLQEGALE